MFRFVRLSTFLGWALASLLCGAGFLLSSFYLYLAPTLPNADQLKTTQLQTPLRIYSSDNKRIAEFGEKRRTPIDIDSLPQYMIDAFIAAEDNRFFEHHGIDIKGLARAVTQLISSGRIKSGGSTITMQVAKNFFLSRERTFIRKFNEIFLALQIENSLSKAEILELYLNKIYLGNRAYGIHAAAKVYYGKEIQDLELAQIAMIAGLPKAPSRYNPLANPSRAKVRRNWILDRMLELNMIKPDQHQRAAAAAISAAYHGARSELEAPYVAEMARREIIEKFGADAYTLGLKAYLTIDSRLQNAANQAVQKGLNRYDQRHGYRGHHQSLLEPELQSTEQIIQALDKIKTPLNHLAALVLSTENGKATLLTRDNTQITLTLKQVKWAKPYINVNKTGRAPKSTDEILKRGDIIEVSKTGAIDQDGNTIWQLAQTPEVQGALVSIAPENGEIKALVGGYDFNLSHYNRATQAKRQPGSNFKPFVYFAALENGSTAATLINDAPIVFEDKNLEASWRPENSSGKFYGPTRLRKALYRSRNLVSIRLLKKTGVNKTLKSVKKFGFDKKDLPKDLSLALGSAAMTPLKVAAGYSMIANGGYYIEPFLLARIEDTDGNVLYRANPLSTCANCQDKEPDRPNNTDNGDLNPAPRIADERAIYILHSMLKDVITKGTGRQAKKLNRSDIAGKTGTTNDQKDAWFSGFNTDIETTVWVGFDNPRTLGKREYGAKAALPIWSDYMKVALKDTEEAHMARPDGLLTVRIDPETSRLAKPGTPNAVFEIFREEYAPRQKAVISSDKPRYQIENKAIRPEDIF